MRKSILNVALPAAMGVVVGAAAVAVGAPRTAMSLTNVPSMPAGLQNSHFMTVQSSYPVRSITVAGSLSAMAGGTSAPEACIRVHAPNGASWVLQPFSQMTAFPASTGSYTFTLPDAVPTANGTWSFGFFELYDDGHDGMADATWSAVTITLNDGAPAAKNIGEVDSPGRHVGMGNVPFGEVRWMQFSIAQPATVLGGKFVDIDTVGTGAGDTEIALYDAAGRLVASDDDDGPGRLSVLTFGVGARPAIGDGIPYDGRDGALDAGTYYLALSPYNATFGVAGWDVSNNGSNSITAARVNITTNIGAGTCPADVDDGSGEGAPDGGVTIDDLLYFLSRFEEGC